MINQTYEKLLSLKLHKMAEIYKEQCNSQAFKELSFDERLAFMVDEEVNDKYNNLVTGIQRRSKIKMMNATLEDIQYYPDRELDKELIMKLSTCSYIDDHIIVKRFHNIIVCTQIKCIFSDSLLPNSGYHNKSRMLFH